MKREPIKSQFERLAEDHFNGDVEKAARTLFTQEPMEVVLYYLEHKGSKSTMKDRQIMMKVYRELLEEGYPGGYDTAVDEQKVAQFFEIRRDEIRTVDPKGIRKKISTNLGIYLLTFIAVVLGGGKPSAATAPGDTFASEGLSGATINYGKYKRLLKRYKTPEYQALVPGYLEKKEYYDRLRDYMDPVAVQKVLDNGLVPYLYEGQKIDHRST